MHVYWACSLHTLHVQVAQTLVFLSFPLGQMEHRARFFDRIGGDILISHCTASPLLFPSELQEKNSSSVRCLRMPLFSVLSNSVQNSHLFLSQFLSKSETCEEVFCGDMSSRTSHISCWVEHNRVSLVPFHFLAYAVYKLVSITDFLQIIL